MFTSSVTSIRKYTMSLLDKIDILITPNAYKKGKLFAALPSPTFGGELAVDGDFADGSTAWTLNPGWSIGGNSARYDGNALGTSIAQNISGVTGGNRYTVTFEVTQNTGDQNNTISLGSTTLTNSTHLPLGCNTFTGVAGFGTALNIYGNSGELLIIRNLTVKQELTGIADLDFTRASAATRVDPLGFINYAGVLPGVEQVTNGNFQQIGPEEVSNGDFDEIGPEEVSNGDFSQEGPEFIDNTNFATDTDWGGSYSINTVTQQLTKTSTGLAYQIDGGITLGVSYKIVVDVASLAGTTSVWVAGNNYNLSVGIQTIYAVGGNSAWNGGRIAINNGYVSGVGSVLNSISVKEIGQAWSYLDSGATYLSPFSNNSVTINNVSGNNRIRQTSVTNADTTYQVTYEITDTDAAVLKYFNGSTYVEIPSTVATHTFYYTRVGTNNAWYFNLTGGNYVTINSVSVKEVGQDWSLTAGWSIGDGVAVRADESGNSPISQSIPVVNGSNYQFSYTRNYVSGGGQTNIYVKLDNVNYTTLGIYNSTVVEEHTVTGTFTAGFTGSMSWNIYGIGTFTGTLDNISVKEVFQGWTVGGTSPELSLGSVTFTSNNQNLFQAWTEETGTTYYIQLEGEGPVRLRTGFAGIPGQMIEVTLPDIITVNTDADTNRIQIYGSSSGTAVLTNVSVVEGGEIDIPRIDYTGGGCPHILVEPQRTNLITYSEDFSDSSWINTYTITPNSIISPDGTLNAYKITLGTGNGNLRTLNSVSSNTDYVFSFYAKRGTASEMKYRVFDFTNPYADIIPKTSYYSQTNTDSWVRIEVPFTTGASTTSIGCYIDSDSQGNGDFYAWGAQLEEGSYATSYIPTEGTVATRAIETYESAEDISSLINDSEGVLFLEMAALNSDTNSVIISINDGSLSNSVAIYYYSNVNNVIANIFSGGNTLSFIGTIPSSGTKYDFNKIALKYKSGDSALWINGIEVVTLADSISLTGLNKISFDYGNGSFPFFGKVKQLQVYDTALTDEELTLLTIPPNSTYSTYAEMANALNYTLQ